MCLKPLEDVVEREAGGRGVRQQPGDESPKPSFVLFRRVGLRRRGADERADAAARLEDARAFELRVDARDRVGVDAQFDGELADGRQLVAGREPAGGNGRAQGRSEEHTSELQSQSNLVCRLLLEKKKNTHTARL